ncbi:hypothetical protein ABG768_022168, partial [Culter alburnus]
MQVAVGEIRRVWVGEGSDMARPLVPPTMVVPATPASGATQGEPEEGGYPETQEVDGEGSITREERDRNETAQGDGE